MSAKFLAAYPSMITAAATRNAATTMCTASSAYMRALRPFSTAAGAGERLGLSVSIGLIFRFSRALTCLRDRRELEGGLVAALLRYSNSELCILSRLEMAIKRVSA